MKNNKGPHKRVPYYFVYFLIHFKNSKQVSILKKGYKNALDCSGAFYLLGVLPLGNTYNHYNYH